MAQQTVVERGIFVPLSSAGNGLIVSPALDNLVATLASVSASGRVYQQELHSFDWQQTYAQLTVYYPSTSDASVMTAINTFITALNTQNGNPVPALAVETHEVSVVRGTA